MRQVLSIQYVKYNATIANSKKLQLKERLFSYAVIYDLDKNEYDFLYNAKLKSPLDKNVAYTVDELITLKFKVWHVNKYFRFFPQLFCVDSKYHDMLFNNIDECPVCKTKLVFNTKDDFKFERACKDICNNDNSFKNIIDDLVSFSKKKTKTKIAETNLERYGSISPFGNKEVQDKIKETNLERYGAENILESKEIRKKIIQTNMEKYGGAAPIASKKIKEKIVNTNFDKYGAAHPWSSPKVKKKIEQTNIKLYGDSSPVRSEFIKNKIAETNLERYGSISPFGNKEVQDKIKETNLERYGVENPAKSETIQDKIKKTNLALYGMESALSSSKVRDKIAETNLERYGCISPFGNKEVQGKIAETNLERYGSISPFGNKEIQGKIAETNLARYGGGVTNLGNKIHNLYGLSLSDLQDMMILDVKDGCTFFQLVEKYDESYTTLRQHAAFSELREIYEELCPKTTESERYIYKLLSDLYPKVTFTLHKKSIKALNSNLLEIDIFSEEYKIAIEFNGIYWHKDSLKKDMLKAEKMRVAGYQFLALNEVDLFDEERLIKILKTLNIDRVKIFARNTTICEVSKREASEFLNKNHIQGSIPSKINLGLFHEGSLVQLMTFDKPRFNKNYSYELIRLATAHGCNVIGGVHKIWNYFIRNKLLSGESVISYCDKRYFSGTVYDRLKFSKTTDTPSHVWIKGDIVLSRYKVQKHKLQALLQDQYNEHCTAEENLINSKWTKIDLFGNSKWHYKKI